MPDAQTSRVAPACAGGVPERAGFKPWRADGGQGSVLGRADIRRNTSSGEQGVETRSGRGPRFAM